MQKKGWLVVGAAFVLGATLAFSQSSFPVLLVAWQEEPPPLIPTVASGVVALGEGAIGLFPDDKTIPTIFTGTTGGIKVTDAASCDSSNRGEIRLLSLSSTDMASGKASSIDALCFCRRYILDEVLQPYAWSCFKTP